MMAILPHRYFMKFSDDIGVIDPGVYDAINRGIIIGSIILSFLILFPGEPFEFRTNADTDTSSSSTTSEDRQFSHSSQDGNNRNLKHDTDGPTKNEKSNNHISEKDGMERNQVSDTSLSNDMDWNLLNFGIYFLLFIGGLLIIQAIYGLPFMQIIKLQFPREAAVLGL